MSGKRKPAAGHEGGSGPAANVSRGSLGFCLRPASMPFGKHQELQKSLRFTEDRRINAFKHECPVHRAEPPAGPFRDRVAGGFEQVDPLDLAMAPPRGLRDPVLFEGEDLADRPVLPPLANRDLPPAVLVPECPRRLPNANVSSSIPYRSKRNLLRIFSWRAGSRSVIISDAWSKR